MKTLHKMVFASWSLALGSIALADSIEIIPIHESGVYIKSVVAGGSGCVGGFVEVDESDPYALATLKFSNFSTDVRGSKSLDRKSCNMVVALGIPAGYEVGLPIAVAEGWFQNRNASVQMRSEFFFLRGGGANPHTVDFRNGYQYFSTPVSVPFLEQAWSGCQTEVPLRMNISITARASSYGQSAHVELEEVKIISPELAGLKLRRCR